MIGRICKCRTIVMPGEPHNCDSLQADSRRRQKKRRAHGRTTWLWQSLRKFTLERDDHQCMLRVDAGCTGLATSVHLRPELEGNHDIAAVDDLTSACAHCHGVVDGRRSRPQGGVGHTARTSARPAPRGARALGKIASASAQATERSSA